MSELVNKINARQLLAKLSMQGEREVDKEAIENIKQYLLRKNSQNSPLYIRVLVAIGALVAWPFFLMFIFLSGIIPKNEPSAFIMWGVALCSIAIVIKFFVGAVHTLKDNFFIQLSIACMWIGKLLFVYGGFDLEILPNNISTQILFIGLISYPLYNVTIDRFFTSFILFFAVFVDIIAGNIHLDSPGNWLNIFYAAELLLCFLLFTMRMKTRFFTPVAYALLCALSINTLFFAYHSIFKDLLTDIQLFRILDSTAIGVFAVMLICWVAGGVQAFFRAHKMVAVLLIGVLTILSASGIIFAISLLILGYAKHNKIITFAGILFLPIFLWVYYYSLDITLMEKSIALIFSGITLLVARAIMIMVSLDREVAL